MNILYPCSTIWRKLMTKPGDIWGVERLVQCRITGAAANICEELLAGKENECKDRRMYFAWEIFRKRSSSRTLFALKISEIVTVIQPDPRFHISLYVDDLQIGYHHTDLNVIQRKMQGCLDKVQKWALNNGFAFSPSKSKTVHFNINQLGVVQ